MIYSWPSFTPRVPRGFKLNFRTSPGGPLGRFVWFSHFEGYAPFRIARMVTFSYHDRLRWFDGVGWVGDHWGGKSGWKAPGRLGPYYNDAGALVYTPQP